MPAWRTMIDVGGDLGELDARVLDKTAILLSSDHGFFLGEHHFYDKRLMYEPSIRVPLMLRYPSRVTAGQKPQRNGTEYRYRPDHAGDRRGRQSGADAGQELPADRRGAASEVARRLAVRVLRVSGFENVKPCRGVRTARYKYIEYFLPPKEYELYDLEKDPDEMDNLYADPKHAKLLAELKTRLQSCARRLRTITSMNRRS